MCTKNDLPSMTFNGLVSALIEPCFPDGVESIAADAGKQRKQFFTFVHR